MSTSFSRRRFLATGGTLSGSMLLGAYGSSDPVAAPAVVNGVSQFSKTLAPQGA